MRTQRDHGLAGWLPSFFPGWLLMRGTPISARSRRLRKLIQSANPVAIEGQADGLELGLGVRVPIGDKFAFTGRAGHLWVG